MDNLEYRKEIWALLKEYEKSKVMTLEEVLDRITVLTEPGQRQKNKKIENSFKFKKIFLSEEKIL